MRTFSATEAKKNNGGIRRLPKNLKGGAERRTFIQKRRRLNVQGMVQHQGTCPASGRLRPREKKTRTRERNGSAGASVKTLGDREGSHQLWDNWGGAERMNASTKSDSYRFQQRGVEAVQERTEGDIAKQNEITHKGKTL